MSIPVDVADLERALGAFGAGYLLTADAEGRVKAVTVEPEVVEGVLVVTGPGRGSGANIAANPAVTLLFPPAEPRGFTLLVDGTARVDGDAARVTPTGAVLHRPAAHADGPPAPDGCGHDCRPVR
jgi:pyridoxamine 5'-phosphate oxidase-like protein